MTTWVSATVLQTLAERGLGQAGATFLAADLAQWVKGRITQDQRTNATSQLLRVGLLTHRLFVEGAIQHTEYTVTADGAAAIAAAASGHVRKSGPKGSRKPSAYKSGSLVVRLWNLVRVRGMVDSDTAAQTLCDAGADDFKKVRATVVKYLRRWTEAGALEESARRVGAEGCSNGFKRFVLTDEWRRSAEPPRWRQIARQAKAGGQA